MIALSQNPFQSKVPSALFLCHFKDYKQPDVLRAMEMIQATSKQLAKVGETIMTDARFHTFHTYVLLGSLANQKDLLAKLVRDSWAERLRQVRSLKEKVVVVLGNSIQLVGPKVLIVPKNENVFLNQMTKSLNVDVTTEGLNLTTSRYDIGFDPKERQDYYLRIIKQLSTHETIYLLDPNVIVSSDGTVKFGSVYSVSKGVIRRETKMPDYLTDKAQATVQKREMISPAKVIYEDDLTTEQKQEIKDTEAQKDAKFIS